LPQDVDVTKKQAARRSWAVYLQYSPGSAISRDRRGQRDFIGEGGLMSYGPNVQLMVRTAASYVDRIIKGEKPGDLPIQQPDRLELIINLKTANAPGSTFRPHCSAAPMR
jgi:ABC transporter substrate binding protein